MPTPISFAPLAGRLAAKAAEIRPADGAKASWANFMALFWCAIFEMLIALCEALDARAAAEAAGLAAAPASRDAEAGFVQALRAERQAPPGEKRARRLTLVPEVQATTPKPDYAPSRTTERPLPPLPGWLGRASLARSGPCLPSLAVLPRNEGFVPAIEHVYIVTISCLLHLTILLAYLSGCYTNSHKE